ncbi:unnamed protein product [Sphacelaria rigidula]
MSEKEQPPMMDQKLCVNGCGFFGSSSTSHMCSKCWKDTMSQSMLDAEGKKDGGDNSTALPPLGKAMDIEQEPPTPTNRNSPSPSPGSAVENTAAVAAPPAPSTSTTVTPTAMSVQAAATTTPILGTKISSIPSPNAVATPSTASPGVNVTSSAVQPPPADMGAVGAAGAAAAVAVGASGIPARPVQKNRKRCFTCSKKVHFFFQAWT